MADIVNQLADVVNYLAKAALRNSVTRRPSRASRSRLRVGDVAMTAAALIKLLGDDEPLLGPDPGAKCLPQQRKRLHQERAPGRRSGRPAERGRHRIGGAAQLRLLDEACDLAGPVGIEHDAGPQIHDPIRARLHGCGPQPLRQRRLRRHDIAAGEIGHVAGRVARAPVGNNDVTHRPGGGARDQARQGRNEHALAIQGRE